MECGIGEYIVVFCFVFEEVFYLITAGVISRNAFCIIEMALWINAYTFFGQAKFLKCFTDIGVLHRILLNKKIGEEEKK